MSACQVQASPGALSVTAPQWAPELPLIGGNSMIVGPLGDVLTRPPHNKDGLLVGQISTADLPSLRRLRRSWPLRLAQDVLAAGGRAPAAVRGVQILNPRLTGTDDLYSPQSLAALEGL